MRGGCVLPGDSYPNWLSFNCDGSSVIFKAPQVEEHNLKSLMCIASSTADNITPDGLKNVLVKNYTKATIQIYKSETLASFKDEEKQNVVSSIEPGNKVEVIFVFGDGFIAKETAIYLVYEESIGKKLELYREPDLNIIAVGVDENECSAKRICTEEDPTDDFNQNKMKKKKKEKKKKKKGKFHWN